jgi:hypothetical protein
MNDFYSPSVVGSKPNRLATLSKISQSQADNLEEAYKEDDKLGVVKVTTSLLDSTVDSTGNSKEIGATNFESGAADGRPAQIINKPPAGSGPWTPSFGGPPDVRIEFQQGTSGVNSNSAGTAEEHQSIASTDYGYRIPFFESQAQNELEL